MARSRGRTPPEQRELLGSTPEPPPVFSSAGGGGRRSEPARPLADRLRPQEIAEVRGQSHLLGPDGPLTRAIAADQLPSMILWGPPGSGKTMLAHVIAARTAHAFEQLNAVLGGVADLRLIVQRAAERRERGQGTIVFVDEIHRFNKAQQDAFLPHVESGRVILIGATTENPSFSVNAAVLSRCQVFRLEALGTPALVEILSRALQDRDKGLGNAAVRVEPEALEQLAQSSRGDARRALGLLESAALLARRGDGVVDLAVLERCRSEQPLLYDKAGEEHYNVVSALIKSMRGSDPDAAIYWLMRMLDAGDDPLFIARRLMIFASEDVGNADPRALEVAVNADRSFRRMGMPEGVYPLAHACLYLASCPKSNSVGRAFQAARAAIAEHGALPVPFKLRNAVTKLMRDDGYGDGYQYPHELEGSYVPGETYLPERLVGERYYEPSDQGLEKAIGERLARLREESKKA
ncbi:MAG TPA: replication-associated recombination protein A [Polyangiaceae bacterium]|nr:replication-associated recombination protein A [Polyangiaceae bacterium]